MKKYKPQHNRLLFIDKKISEGKFPNCSSLAEEWEVSAKTIQRDIEYMRYQLDAPIEYSAKSRGFFYTEQNFSLPAMSIKESDIFAIYLAEELLEQYKGTPLYDRLNSVYKKIEDSLPEKQDNLDLPNTRFTVFSPPSTKIDPQIWDIAFNCVRAKKRLKIDYQPPGKAVSTRQLDPYHAVRYDGDWYIIGYCHQRRAVRTFSLSRFLKVTELDIEFTIPEDFDFDKISSSRFGVHWGGDEQQVIIQFSASAAPYVIEREWHPSQQIEMQPDGKLVLQLKVVISFELKKWILSWGSQAKVLAPPTLVDSIKTELKCVTESYF